LLNEQVVANNFCCKKESIRQERCLQIFVLEAQVFNSVFVLEKQVLVMLSVRSKTVSLPYVRTYDG